MNGVKEASKNQFEDFPTRLVKGKDIHRHGFEFIMIDELDKLSSIDGPVILNHDTTNGNGTHWVMIYLQRHPNPVLYYYDPLGPKHSPIPQRLMDFAARNNIPIVMSPYSHQYVKSNLCGYYAVVAAKVLRKILGRGNLTPELFLRAMYEVHGASPDKNDVERLVKLY